MTTLIGKFYETNQRFQQLTVWRPTDKDPFIELDRWRINAHQHIEQIYLKKRQQIEQLMDKHQREFMRQISRQRTLLTGIQKRLSGQKDITSYLQAQDDSSLLTELQRIDNDIRLKLGRAEILIETIQPNLDDSVIVSLKTYLSGNPAAFSKELSSINKPKKPILRTPGEVNQAYVDWVHGKNRERAMISDRELQSAKEHRQRARENQAMRETASRQAFNRWMEQKESIGAFLKKPSNPDENDAAKET